MPLDKKFEAMLKKKMDLEKLKVEYETTRDWHEKISRSFSISNDLKSLDINLKQTLKAMETRINVIKSQMKELV